MKILTVAESFKPMWETGGVARVAYEISHECAKEENTVTVCTLNKLKKYSCPSNTSVSVDGMDVYYLKLSILSSLHKYLGFMPSIDAVKLLSHLVVDAQIIHIHDYRSVLTVIVTHYARKYHVPYIIQAHGALPKLGKAGLKGIFDKIWGKQILNDATKVIALHDLEKAQYVELGVPENKIAIIPNGINVEEYRHLPERGLFRDKYGITSEERVVLFLGRIDPIKGVDILVDAFAQIQKTISNARLVIVGPLHNHEYVEFLKKKINDYVIEDRVLFTGPLFEKEKIQAYVAADVYVLPSRYDCFPNSIFEACACGTPIIVSRECGCYSLISKFDCGYFVHSGDLIGLTNQIIDIFRDINYATNITKNGKRYIFEKLSWHTIGKQVCINYQSAIEFKEINLR